MNMEQPWLETLHTETPQLGFELAVKLSRVAVKLTQPSDEIRQDMRSVYERDVAALIASSQVVATNFATVSAANNWWRATV
jgi:Hexameric tyrosine-coordinated heme protein (HTHP)